MIPLLLIGFGVWTYLQPEAVLKFKTQWAKKFGITMKTSSKTPAMFKKLGLVLIGIGAILWLLY